MCTSPSLNNFHFTPARTDKEEKDTNGWYLYVLTGAAILILIIAIGLLVIFCRRRSGQKDTATAKGDGEAELEVVMKPKVSVDSKDKCTTALQNDCSKDPVGVVLMKDFRGPLLCFLDFRGCHV